MEKKGKRVEIPNDEIALPEPLIQHVQSFLSGKEAARTTVLSKSWYSAWLTHPALDLKESNFPNNGGNSSPEYERFVTRTMQRYHDLSMKIDSFRLRTFTYERRDIALKNWIVSAIGMGATDVELDLPYFFILPQEVFRSEAILKLSIKSCRVEGSYVVRCSRLKSLRLERVTDISNDVFNDIMLCCNSIEELTLSQSYGLPLGLMNMYEFPKLRHLILESVDVDSMFFNDFASRFPCLKDLTIHSCRSCTRIQIASTLLETISFRPYGKSYKAVFDVPNVRKFTCSASCLPNLSIKAVSREWELDIDISCNGFHKASWFLNLKKLLRKFKLSTISLSLSVWCKEHQGSSEHEVDIEVFPDPLEVENLSFVVPSPFCYALLVRLFGIIRPKFITYTFYHDSPQVLNRCLFGIIRRKFITKADSSVTTLYKRLMQQVITPNCGIPHQVLFEQFGLKKVNMEVFDPKRRPLVLKKPLDLSEAPIDWGKFRFELIWE